MQGTSARACEALRYTTALVGDSGVPRRLRADRGAPVAPDVADDRPVRAVPRANAASAANREPMLLAVRVVGQQLHAETAGHPRAVDPAAATDPDRAFAMEE